MKPRAYLRPPHTILMTRESMSMERISTSRQACESVGALRNYRASLISLTLSFSHSASLAFFKSFLVALLLNARRLMFGDMGMGEIILLSIEDITELKKAAEILKKAAEAKLKFASTVSHELRSPLAAITLGIYLVLEDPAGLSAEYKSLLKPGSRGPFILPKAKAAT